MDEDQVDESPLSPDSLALVLSKGAAGVVKSSTNSTNGGSSSYVDPFTGGARYVPSLGETASSTTQGADPFTGSGRYVPPSSEPVLTKSQNSYFPIRDFLRFDQANIDAITSMFFVVTVIT